MAVGLLGPYTANLTTAVQAVRPEGSRLMLKWVVRFSLGVVAFILLAAAALAGFPWGVVLWERLGSETYRAHLAANERVLALEAADAGFMLRAEDLGAKYILLGEMHGFAFPQRLDLALVAYLQNAGPPRWYLAEMTPAEAIAVNEYIGGGDDAAVRAVFDRFAQMGVQWANHEFFEKLMRFRQLNERWPTVQQIRFIGIDRDREDDAASAFADVERLRADLGDPASALGINLRLQAVSAEGNGRYPVMRARLTELAALPNFEIARFMGLWGLFHTSEARINGSAPLAMWLRDETAVFAGDVLTINTMCIGQCFNMMPAPGIPALMAGPDAEEYTYIPMGIDNPYFQRPVGVSDLIAVLGDERAALYRLSGDASPYREGHRLSRATGYLVMARPWTVEGSAADMTDYLIVYRNSAPLTPWSGRAFDLSGRAAASIAAAR
jgi:hypothetical protein